MADPEAVGKAFLEQFYNALDNNNAAVLGGLFQDSSTMSFEGETIKGVQAIGQKLTSLGLPPKPERRITSVCGQNSCCGNGAIIVFVTGEWVKQQYSESFQLVPTGNNSYFIYNYVFRVGMTNNFNVPPEGAELIKSFMGHYYQQYDGGLETRRSLQALYGPTSVASFERDEFVGPESIMAKMQELPLVQHDPNMAVDVQLINGLDIVLIVLWGQMSIDGTNPMKFSQLFLIQKVNGSYIIGNQIFRLNYG